MKKTKKITLFLLVASLFTNMMPVKAFTKDETVYSKLNSDGSVNNITVSEFLKNDSLDTINDETNLKNILNINGDEKYELKNNSLVWQAGGKDIYYQGEIEKDLPISLNITYKLDGKEMSLDDMLGKKGHVIIKIKYTNNEVNNVNINGTNTVLYTPFVVTLGTVISNENNSNVNVTNGKVVSNGANSIVVALASPGLYESLDIDDLKDFDTIKIDYDTDNFELSSIYSVVSSKLIEKDDLNIFDKLDSVYSKIDTLKNSSTKLVNGSNQLLDGSKKLTTGVSTLNSGITEVYNGSKKISTLLSDNIEQTQNSAAIDNDTISYIKSEAADKANQKIVASKNEIESTAQNLIKQDSTYQNYAGVVNSAIESGAITEEQLNICLSNPNVSTIDCNNTTVGQILSAKKIMILMETVAKETAYKTAQNVANETSLETSEIVAREVAENAKNKSLTALNTLNQGINNLTNGLERLNNGSNELVNGTITLSDGINTLANGLSQFDKEGIDSIVKLVNGDAKTLELKIKELEKLGSDYNTFTMKPDSVDGETKFVLMIDAQAKKVVENDKKTSKDDKKSLWDKIKDLF